LLVRHFLLSRFFATIRNDSVKILVAFLGMVMISSKAFGVQAQPCSTLLEEESLDFWLPDENSEVGSPSQKIIEFPAPPAKTVSVQPELGKMMNLAAIESGQKSYVSVSQLVGVDPHLSPVFIASSKLSENGESFVPLIKTEDRPGYRKLYFWNVVDQREDSLFVPKTHEVTLLEESKPADAAKTALFTPVRVQTFNYAEQIGMHGLEIKAENARDPIAFLLWDEVSPSELRIEYTWTRDTARQQGLAIDLQKAMVEKYPEVTRLGCTLADSNRTAFFTQLAVELKSNGIISTDVSAADFLREPQKYLKNCCADRPKILNPFLPIAFRATPRFKINNAIGFTEIQSIEISNPFTDPTIQLTAEKPAARQK
jgi:hypothetical protein